MNINNLSGDEIKIIQECIKAAAYGPFFIDKRAKDDPFWEIHPLFGLYIDELREIADAFPNINLETKDVKLRLAINNSVNNLLGYPHKCTDEVWSQYISVSKERLREIFVKLRGEKVNSYFDGLM